MVFLFSCFLWPVRHVLVPLVRTAHFLLSMPSTSTALLPISPTSTASLCRRTGPQRLGRALLAWFFVCLPLLGWGQTTIAIQDFETTPATPTALVNVSGGSYYTGQSASGDRPASSPFYSQGARSYGISNGTATITSSSDIDINSYTGVAITFRLAAFSVNSSTNGLDAPDAVTVAVSTDGGSSYTEQVEVTGFWQCLLELHHRHCHRHDGIFR